MFKFLIFTLVVVVLSDSNFSEQFFPVFREPSVFYISSRFFQFVYVPFFLMIVRYINPYPSIIVAVLAFFWGTEEHSGLDLHTLILKIGSQIMDAFLNLKSVIGFFLKGAMFALA